MWSKGKHHHYHHRHLHCEGGEERALLHARACQVGPVMPYVTDFFSNSVEQPGLRGTNPMEALTFSLTLFEEPRLIAVVVVVVVVGSGARNL
ncbi:hypothetical protein E2C01_040657 [Portunus trituberculatus]|uniref:Uncharacterized protein n=1 Tax=Portunus trituberculatus TaxID=210409 RepID=A0A5B7FN24_PORTR|nr:hypothetical protein [Portunus trituberculatus]